MSSGSVWSTAHDVFLEMLLCLLSLLCRLLFSLSELVTWTLYSILSHLVCGTAHLLVDPRSVRLVELTGEVIEIDSAGVLFDWSAPPDTVVRMWLGPPYSVLNAFMNVLRIGEVVAKIANESCIWVKTEANTPSRVGSRLSYWNSSQWRRRMAGMIILEAFSASWCQCVLESG